MHAASASPFGLALLPAGCVLHSDVPLSDPDKPAPNEKLLGNGYPRGEDDPLTLIVKKAPDGYPAGVLVLSLGGEDSGNHTLLFTTELKGQTYANLCGALGPQADRASAVGPGARGAVRDRQVHGRGRLGCRVGPRRVAAAGTHFAREIEGNHPRVGFREVPVANRFAAGIDCGLGPVCPARG